MESIKELYIIGPGPSSSHTIGPSRAANNFIKDLKNVDKIVVSLFGSLALTGKGHFSDKVIKDVLNSYETEIIFNMDEKNLKHPNTMNFKAIKDGKIIKEQFYYSIGGGKSLLI